MSLLHSFPEIDLFFKQERFSQESLNELLYRINGTYSDKSVLKSAKSLIELEILKYDLLKDYDLNNGLKARETFGKSKFDNFSRIIKVLSISLEVRPKFILELLKQHRVNKSEDEILSEEEFSQLKPYIKSRVKALGRKKHQTVNLKKLKNPFKKKNECDDSPSSSSSVFDEIAKYGLGRIIYIRSK